LAVGGWQLAVGGWQLAVGSLTKFITKLYGDLSFGSLICKSISEPPTVNYQPKRLAAITL
jgi:hypothetical protein